MSSPEYEWEEYPEPLWDPLKSEAQLLVREYFEEADRKYEQEAAP